MPLLCNFLTHQLTPTFRRRQNVKMPWLRGSNVFVSRSWPKLRNCAAQKCPWPFEVEAFFLHGSYSWKRWSCIPFYQERWKDKQKQHSLQWTLGCLAEWRKRQNKDNKAQKACGEAACKGWAKSKVAWLQRCELEMAGDEMQWRLWAIDCRHLYLPIWVAWVETRLVLHLNVFEV